MARIFLKSVAYHCFCSFCREENNDGEDENWDEDTVNSSDQFDPNSK